MNAILLLVIFNAPANAIFMTVRDKRGKIESATVYEPWVKSEPSPRPIKTFMGDGDITMSMGATYKTLDRPKSGLYTGKPLVNEEIETLPLAEAKRKFDALYEKEFKPHFKKWGWWFPKRHKNGRFAPR